jgi:hypothetical protein
MARMVPVLYEPLGGEKKMGGKRSEARSYKYMAGWE